MGEIFALLTGFTWAIAVILFKKSGEKIPPFALNFFRVGIGSVFFIVTFLFMKEPLWGRAPLEDYLILTLSGFLAIAISDTLFHKCLNMVGAGINAIVDTLYSPFIVFFAFMFLGERFTFWHYSGMVVILTGVILTTRIDPPEGRTKRQLLVGISYGVISMATIGLGIVIAKPVLDRSPVVWATAVRQIGSLVTMLPALLIPKIRREVFAAFVPQKHWKFMIPGTVLGSYLALMLWIAGMKYSQAGVAAILNQTSSIHILIFASIFLKEPFTRHKAAAAILALCGVLMVTLG